MLGEIDKTFPSRLEQSSSLKRMQIDPGVTIWSIREIPEEGKTKIEMDRKTKILSGEKQLSMLLKVHWS